MSKGYRGARHDDTKELQHQLGAELLERGKKYTKEEIAKIPSEVQKKASVKVITTRRDQELAKQRLDNAKERKARSRKSFPTIDELRQSAQVRGVDNDQNWEYVDEGTKEKRAELDQLSRKSFWDKIPASLIGEEMMRVLPRLPSTEYTGLTTKAQHLVVVKNHLTKIMTALSEDQYDDIEGWSDMDRYSRIQKFITTEECRYLQQHKENTKKIFNA